MISMDVVTKGAGGHGRIDLDSLEKHGNQGAHEGCNRHGGENSQAGGQGDGDHAVSQLRHNCDEYAVEATQNQTH